jgi:putative endonuclease
MFYTYILASRRNGTLYTGSTDDLRMRVEQHRAGKFGGFTARYGVRKLAWFEAHPTRDEAFVRERRIKEWRRLWKQQLIEARNPNWVDLYPDLDRLLMEDEQRSLAQFPTNPRTPLIPVSPHPLIPAKAGTQAGRGGAQTQIGVSGALVGLFPGFRPPRRSPG